MTTNHASSEYGSVLSDELNTEILVEFCINGGLRTTCLRSIVWRILLKCLPISKVEWAAVAKRARADYVLRKKKLITDPHEEGFSEDPQKNNPLAENDDSPWKRFFADHDLRDIIRKDVDRTFPEMEFFQQSHIRDMMCDILLIYAKENSYVSYKQGMHEVLAPLMFVVYSDQQSYLHAKEGSGVGEMSASDAEILDVVYDPDFLEHDSYLMFSELMMEVSKWYEDADTPNRDNNAPYSRSEDSLPNSAVMHELREISARLQEVDPVLSEHLRTLDISPQFYGIRWLRLLFGREYPIHDLLYLWDVIISDRPIPRIVECVFVAMLVQIRELLVSSDYSGCLQYLMRYPPTADITTFVQLCRHYRFPKKITRPILLGSNNFANITVTGATHPNNFREVIGYEEPPSGSGMRPKSRSMLSKVRESITDRQSPSISSPKRTPVKEKNMWDKEVAVMEDQVATLQSRLNEKDIICSEVSHQLNQIANMLSTSAPNEDGRRLLSDKLRHLGTKLTAEIIPRTHIPMRSTQRSGIDVAREVRAPVPRPRIAKDNEMVELKR